jgi:D-lactate dehydrogenase
MLLGASFLLGVALDVYEREGELAVALRSNPIVGAASRREGDATIRTGEAATAAIRTWLDRPNVILTPHNAFNTAEAVERKAEQTVQQIEHFLQRSKFLWPVP